VAKCLLGVAGARVVLSVGFDSQTENGSSIRRFAVNFPNFTNIDYLSRMFSVVQQQLRDNIVALQDVLPYVTATLTSVTYVDQHQKQVKTLIFPTYTRN
jgi:hypothetical protein